jgi:hypothetical protein
LPAVKAILEGVKAMWYVLGFLGLVGIAALVAMVRVVEVEEATSVAFKFTGEFAYRAMSLVGYHFDANGKICEGNGPKHLGQCRCIWKIGGWVFYLRPFVKPTQYEERNDPDGFGYGIYVHLSDITPEPVTSAAETKSPENVALTVKFVMTMRIVDPGLWLFRAPRDATKQVVKRLQAALRSWIRSGDQDHVQSARGDGEKLWAELMATDVDGVNCKLIFDRIEQRWGLRILEGSIVVEDVDYELGYQQALQAKSKAQLEAGASVAETAGRVNLAVAEELGMTVEELKARLSAEPKFKKTPEYKEAVKFAKQLLVRDRAAAKGDLRDIRIGGSNGEPFGKGTLAEIVGGVAAAFAAKDAGGGKQSNRGGKSRKGVYDRGNPEENLDEAFRD